MKITLKYTLIVVRDTLFCTMCIIGAAFIPLAIVWFILMLLTEYVNDKIKKL